MTWAVWVEWAAWACNACGLALKTSLGTGSEDLCPNIESILVLTSTADAEPPSQKEGGFFYRLIGPIGVLATQHGKEMTPSARAVKLTRIESILKLMR